MFGIGMGPSGQENQQYNLLNSTSQFATGLGEGNTTAASTFFTNLLNDPFKALTPEISAVQNQTQNAARNNAVFGSRSGGTAASTAAASNNARGDILNAAVGAQTGAAGELGSLGSNLLSTGQSGTEAAFGEAQTLQQQRQAKINDIIKSSLAVAAAPFTGGTSLTGLGINAPKGFSDPFSGGLDDATFQNLLDSGTVSPTPLDMSTATPEALPLAA
jgi:hypothetical protein